MSSMASRTSSFWSGFTKSGMGLAPFWALTKSMGIFWLLAARLKMLHTRASQARRAPKVRGA